MALRRRPAQIAAAYALALSFVFFAVFPILWTLITSLKLERDIIKRTVTLIPNPVTLENYYAIWTQSNLPTLMVNSAITTFYTAAICVGAGMLAAYAVSRLRFRGRHSVLLFLLVLRMFPVVLMVIPLFIIMRNAELLDTRIGLALAYTGFLLPIFIWMMKGFFDASRAS